MQRVSIEELQERWDRYRMTFLAEFEKQDKEWIQKAIEQCEASEEEKENKRK